MGTAHQLIVLVLRRPVFYSIFEFSFFINCMLSKMCHNFISTVAGQTVLAVFVVAGLLMLCTSVNEAKKLTEATEENCEGAQIYPSPPMAPIQA